MTAWLGLVLLKVDVFHRKAQACFLVLDFVYQAKISLRTRACVCMRACVCARARMCVARRGVCACVRVCTRRGSGRRYTNQTRIYQHAHLHHEHTPPPYTTIRHHVLTPHSAHWIPSPCTIALHHRPAPSPCTIALHHRPAPSPCIILLRAKVTAVDRPSPIMVLAY